MNPLATSIREAGLRDIEVAVALFAKLDELERDWRVFQRDSNPLAQAHKRYRRLIRSGNGLVLLAEMSGRPVGLGVGEIVRPSSYSNEAALELSNLYIEPAHRGRGIGAIIVNQLLTFASQRELDHVVLKVFAPNAAAIDFWTHLGFAPRLIQFTRPTKFKGKPSRRTL